MLPRPYVGSYSSERGHQTKSLETFVPISISDMPTIKYCQNLGTMMDTEKEKIPKQFGISDTCFTSLETIGGNLFTRHPRKLNNAHKDSNDLLSVP